MLHPTALVAAAPVPPAEQLLIAGDPAPAAEQVTLLLLFGGIAGTYDEQVAVLPPEPPALVEQPQKP